MGRGLIRKFLSTSSLLYTSLQTIFFKDMLFLKLGTAALKRTEKKGIKFKSLIIYRGTRLYYEAIMRSIQLSYDSLNLPFNL